MGYMTLTRKQLELADYVETFAEDNRRLPTTRETAAATGRSAAAVSEMMNTMRRRGWNPAPGRCPFCGRPTEKGKAHEEHGREVVKK